MTAVREQQFKEAVSVVFGTETGRWLLDELERMYARPFTVDPYKTAFNCGAQDLVQFLKEVANGMER